MIAVASGHDQLEFEIDTQMAGTWLGDAIQNLGMILYQSKMQTQNPGQSVLGFENKLGMLWQNPVTCAACSAVSETSSFLLDNKIVTYGLEQLVGYG